MNQLKLAQLLCSRLCHDLITPVGAINNGFEFLDHHFTQIDPELGALIQKSAQNAAQRLNTFRAGYSSGGQNLLPDFKKAAQMINSYLSLHRVDFLWPEIETAMMCISSQDQPQWGRIFVNMTTILATSASKGGTLQLSFNEQNSHVCCEFLLQGNLIPIRQDNLLAFEGRLTEEDLTVYSIQSYVTFLLMEESAFRFYLLENTPDVIRIHLANSGASLQKKTTLF
jgi:histidine phosphotransferase ChpT